MSTPLLEDAELTFPFELRVDRVVEGAKAEVALPEWGNPFESDHANDSAWIVLNGSDGSTDGGTGQTDGGTSGGTAPPGPGQDGDSGSSGTSGSSGSGGTSGSSGSGASGTSGDVTGGGLASTGAGGAALIGGAALLALGLGAGLFLFLRRGARHTGGTAA